MNIIFKIIVEMYLEDIRKQLVSIVQNLGDLNQRLVEVEDTLSTKVDSIFKKVDKVRPSKRPNYSIILRLS